MHANDRRVFQTVTCRPFAFLSSSTIRRHFLFHSFGTTVSYLLVQLPFISFIRFFIFDSIVDALSFRRAYHYSCVRIPILPFSVSFHSLQFFISSKWFHDGSSVADFVFDFHSSHGYLTLSHFGCNFSHFIYISRYNS